MYLAIIILPLLGSIVSGFFGRKTGISGAQIITYTAVVITRTSAVLAFFDVGSNNLPKPHQFIFAELKSSGLDFSSIGRLLEKKKDMEVEISDLRQDRLDNWNELKKAKGTLTLANHVDDSKNNALRELKRDYPSYFDEDSGNNTKEGLEQVVDYLNEEHSDLQSRVVKLKKEIQSLDRKIAISKQLNNQLGESSNVNSIFLILTRPFYFVPLRTLIHYVLPYFSLFITIFSLLFISFVFPSLNVPYFMQNIFDYIFNIIKYEVVISLLLLLWSFYTYTKKIKKYFSIGKNVIRFVKTSYYIDIWILLVIFTIIIFF